MLVLIALLAGGAFGALTVARRIEVATAVDDDIRQDG